MKVAADKGATTLIHNHPPVLKGSKVGGPPSDADFFASMDYNISQNVITMLNKRYVFIKTDKVVPIIARDIFKKYNKNIQSKFNKAIKKYKQEYQNNINNGMSQNKAAKKYYNKVDKEIESYDVDLVNACNDAKYDIMIIKL